MINVVEKRRSPPVNPVTGSEEFRKVNAPLLDVVNLRTHFFTKLGVVPAVDGISFGVEKGTTLGVVGESGCGKSVTALSIMRLVSNPPGKIIDGSIWFNGEDLIGKTEAGMREVRGNQISMIYQEPMTSFNPVYTIGDQISEAIIRHKKISNSKARKESVKLLTQVGIPAPEKRYDNYPHQLSGGMRQRAMIAMALSCSPELLIADEPTTALDVTIQAQILELLSRLKNERDMTIIIITHDLGVVAEFADNVIVMYAGKIVEEASTRDIFKSPQHPYTKGLLASIPRLDMETERLAAIEGNVPSGLNLPSGCPFHNRCGEKMEVCESVAPVLKTVAPGHNVRCLAIN